MAERSELQAAIVAFGAAIETYLTAELDRWVPEPEDLDSAETRLRASRHYEARTVVTAARYRLELATTDGKLLESVKDVWELVGTVREVARSEMVAQRIRDVHADVETIILRGRGLSRIGEAVRL
jgi:hypothetical protein